MWVQQQDLKIIIKYPNVRGIDSVISGSNK